MLFPILGLVEDIALNGTPVARREVRMNATDAISSLTQHCCHVLLTSTISLPYTSRFLGTMSSSASHVMSNREFEAFMKERKLQAYKKCDPIVQGTPRAGTKTWLRICGVLAEPLVFRRLGLSGSEQEDESMYSSLVRLLN